MRLLPQIATKLCYLHDGWIVGSFADPIQPTPPKDIDILIPFSNWKEAVALVPATATINTFGGWKFKDENMEVDVWPGDLAWLMTNNMVRNLWHPRTDSRFKRSS